jgi:hypothetical protein
MRVFFGSEIAPVSVASSPVMARNSVVLPVPSLPADEACLRAGRQRQRSVVDEKAPGDAERNVIEDKHGARLLAKRGGEGKWR